MSHSFLFNTTITIFFSFNIQVYFITHLFILHFDCLNVTEDTILSVLCYIILLINDVSKSCQGCQADLSGGMTGALQPAYHALPGTPLTSCPSAFIALFRNCNTCCVHRSPLFPIPLSTNSSYSTSRMSAV